MDYRTIGYITGTHGLRGEVKVKPQTHFIEERFAKHAMVFLEDGATMKELHVMNAREQKGMIIVKFVEANDINEVEAWRGKRLCIREDQLQELDEDEIYYHDLLHMQVETKEHQQLGEVVEILETGAHVIIRIKGEQEFLLPYIKPFILEANVEEKRLIVELIEGML